MSDTLTAYQETNEPTMPSPQTMCQAKHAKLAAGRYLVTHRKLSFLSAYPGFAGKPAGVCLVIASLVASGRAEFDRSSDVLRRGAQQGVCSETCLDV
jgi:hypothetical protein